PGRSDVGGRDRGVPVPGVPALPGRLQGRGATARLDGLRPLRCLLLRRRRVRGRVARRGGQARRRLLRGPPLRPPLLHRLLRYFEKALGDPSSKPNLHLANRLDRDTSGLMVITKCNKVAAKLVKAFTEHKVKKTYLALCIGYPPAWEKIKICSGHGRSKHGAWRVYAMSDVGRTLPGGSSVRDMSTKFEVLGTDGEGQYREPSNVDIDDIESITVQEKAADQISNVDVKNHMIFVRAYPQSGRTHQIRLHCQYLGFPIRGDVKYGGVIEWNGVDCDGHALHAESLSFVHPVTGLLVTFRAPLPSWANETISTMG
uniref:Pseudouridine synthase RsuA/RluA-like domain-containing protein n=2 Tax=Aegilops tauschii subsp. strangulata TaxID=200361 RepID=A0A453JZ30_AEGTS